jgi:outer membrane lipoprotein carrier protein
MNKLATIFLLAISTVLFAQDQVAKDVLEKLSTTTKSYKNITIGFDFIFENTSQNIKETQKGILILEDKNFRLEMDAQTIINDGESQWVYLTDMNELQIMEHDPEDDMMSPNKLFTIYEKGYKYTYIGAEAEKGKRLQIIDLFPEESGAFIKVTLAVDAAKNQLNTITIFDKNGGNYSYKVNTFTTNSNNLAPFTFNLSKYPNVEVIDLR